MWVTELTLNVYAVKIWQTINQDKKDELLNRIKIRTFELCSVNLKIVCQKYVCDSYFNYIYFKIFSY